MALADATKWAPYVYAAAERRGIPAGILMGLVARESKFEVGAYNPEGDGTDPSRGLAQVRESTARALGYSGPGGNLFDPSLNLDLAARLLADNLAIATRSAPSAGAGELLDRALSAYNAGFSAVRKGDAKRDTRGELINRPYVDDIHRLASTLSPLVATKLTPTSPPAGFYDYQAPPGSAIAGAGRWILPGLAIAGLAALLLRSRPTHSTPAPA